MTSNNESEQIIFETNSPYSFLFNYFLIHYFDLINSLKSDKYEAELGSNILISKTYITIYQTYINSSWICS